MYNLNGKIEKVYAEATMHLKEDWFSSSSTEWYDHVMSLQERVRDTYLIVILHNQVFNGGFHQYFINRYGQFAYETIEALKRIRAFKKAKLLSLALKVVNPTETSRNEFRIKIWNRTLETIFDSDASMEPLDNLDEQYYELEDDENIGALLDDYLTNGPKP